MNRLGRREGGDKLLHLVYVSADVRNKSTMTRSYIEVSYQFSFVIATNFSTFFSHDGENVTS